MGMKKELIPLIESNLNKMTTTEKEIAAYFLERRSVDDVTTSFFCEQLHVSKASLTRFSKKCGFNGFREFLYRYRD
ncbi:MurR/RpiR family transcriptional regulator, partial [Streptococcus canis]